MNVYHIIRRQLTDPLRSFKTLQIAIAGICIFIPVILRCTDINAFYPKNIALATLVFDTTKPFNHTRIDSTTCLSKNASGLRQYVAAEVLHIQIDSAARIRKDAGGFRASLSDYVYGNNSHIFGLLYCMAALMFIYNGVVYLNQKQALKLNHRAEWCNILTGFSLLGVAFCPYHDVFIVHTVFTVLFFGLNIYALGFLPNPCESTGAKNKRKVIAAVLVIALLLSIHYQKVLWGEWFALFFIALHLIQIARSAEKT